MKKSTKKTINLKSPVDLLKKTYNLFQKEKDFHLKFWAIFFALYALIGIVYDYNLYQVNNSSMSVYGNLSIFLSSIATIVIAFFFPILQLTLLSSPKIKTKEEALEFGKDLAREYGFETNY